MSSAHGKGRCGVLSHAVITISEDLILQVEDRTW